MPHLVPPAGPADAEVVLLGEAPGQQEEAYGIPFIGHSGKLLREMLAAVGLDFDACYRTNVFKERPPENKVEHFFTNSRDPDARKDLPRYGTKYLRGQYAHYLHSTEHGLLAELSNLPKLRLVIALGNTALWAISGQTGISLLRGVISSSSRFTYIPTFHPAAVLRQYNQYPIVIADLQKAKDFLDGTIVKPSLETFTLHLDPTLDDLAFYLDLARNSPLLSVDLETAAGQIRTVGVGVSPTCAFVIPFFDLGLPSYWPTPEAEVQAWKCVQEIMALPQGKVFHNGLYDLQYLVKYKIKVINPAEDTMLLHFALQPEMQKGLGFLGSLYLNSEAWKEVYHKRAAEGGKRDE